METILGDTVALIRQKSFCFSAFLFAFWKKKILSDKEQNKRNAHDEKQYNYNKITRIRVLPLTEFVGYRAVNLRYIFGILRNRQRGLPLKSVIWIDIQN